MGASRARTDGCCGRAQPTRCDETTPGSRSGRPDRLFLRRHRGTARTRRHRAQCVCLWCVPGGQPSRTAARSRGNTCVQRVRFGCCRLRGGRLSGPGVRGQPAGRGPPPACAHVRGSAALGGVDGVRAVWFPFTVFAARACGVRARGRGRARARRPRRIPPGQNHIARAYNLVNPLDTHRSPRAPCM